MAKEIDLNAKASSDDGIFGLPYNEKESTVIYLPVPWDVTTSYGNGTHKGPKAMLNASAQIDFFDLDYIDAFKTGLFMTKENSNIKKLNKEGRKLAEKIIEASENEIKKSKALQKTLAKVNEYSDKLNDYVYKETKRVLKMNKMSVLVGGDHSTPFGAIKAYAEKYEGMGILHFDAHSDTRNAYMGFNHSHASIMHNVMTKISGVSKLVQVGIRDFCQEEYEFIESHKKIKTFFDAKLAERKMKGETKNCLFIF
jgi:agmatinase